MEEVFGGLLGDLWDLEGLKPVIEDKQQRRLSARVLVRIISFPSRPPSWLRVSGKPPPRPVPLGIDHGEALVKDVYPSEPTSLLTHLYI